MTRLIERVALASLLVSAVAWAHHPNHHHSAPQCRWTTVDDFILPATDDAVASAVLVTQNSVYVAGMSLDALSGHWVVRKKKLHSGGWKTVDDFIYSIGLRAHPEGIGRTSNGDIYVAGGANNTSNGGAWLVRKSSDRGQSWSLVDEFADLVKPASSAQSLAIDGSGNIWVSGFHNVTPDSYHWVVRESQNGGASWSTEQDMAPTMFSASAESVAVDSAGTAWASGHNFDGAKWHWQTQRREQGGSWVTVDDFQLNPQTDAFPATVVAPQAGVVYVAGYGTESTGAGHWVVRKTSNDGASWSTVDDLFNGFGCGARGMTYSAKEQALYTTGRCFDGVQYQWLVRRSTNGGASWATDDTYVRNAGFTSQPGGVAAREGHVFAVGVGRDGTHNHWIVRERVCSGGCSH